MGARKSVKVKQVSPAQMIGAKCPMLGNVRKGDNNEIVESEEKTKFPIDMGRCALLLLE